MSLVKNIWIGDDHPDLEGHFNGFQLLPGVTQIELVKNYISEICEKSVQITEVRNAKFYQMLRPPGQYEIEIKLTDDKSEASWVLKNKNEIYSKGILSYD